MENGNNKSDTIYINYHGEIGALKLILMKIGRIYDYKTIFSRIRYSHYEPEDAIDIPIKRYK
jgi:hypothetical protein